MHRLNNRAYEILAAEVKRLTQDTLDGVRRDIILRRLNKLRVQPGTPLTATELKAEIEDMFPELDDRVLQRAARANKGAGRLGWIKTWAIGATVVAGGIWFVNLPYPMIRWPVSRTAPILLLPSFLSMDHHYRQAIATVEQADQLLNQATSPQDIELGAEKVDQAQASLDKLPVWFLGYYPRSYCTLVSCTWRFTYDEFATARQAVGRMEAQVFQEDNALQLLEDGTAAVEAAKATYQTATTTQDKMDAVAAWQSGMDMLHEIPSQTLAGRMAETKLAAYERDFSQVSGILSGGNRTTTLIQAAKEFAWTASMEAQQAPLPPEDWQRIADLWQQAVNRLGEVPLEDVGYGEAQRMLAEYTNKLGVVQGRLAAEERSRSALNAAQNKNADLAGRVQYLNDTEYAGELQRILNDLDKVEQGTTAYEPAQQLRQAVQSRLQEVAARRG